MNTKIFSLVIAWLPFAALATIFAGLVYGAVQQDIRQSANDPQIQMSEDIARALETGKKPDTFTNETKVDIAKSLAPFIMIYDDSGHLISTNATIDGVLTPIPSGVFDFVRKERQDRITWQPREGVRIASITTRYSGAQSGFVLVGRNMREIEERESKLTLQVELAWLAALATTLLIVWFQQMSGKQIS